MPDRREERITGFIASDLPFSQAFTTQPYQQIIITAHEDIKEERMEGCRQKERKKPYQANHGRTAARKCRPKMMQCRSGSTEIKKKEVERLRGKSGE